jgi:membrane-associated phospholipid phosphatase
VRRKLRCRGYCHFGLWRRGYRQLRHIFTLVVSRSLSELKLGLYRLATQIRTESSKSAESWVRWPNSQCWIAFVSYGLPLTILWLVVYGGSCWITSLHPYRVHLETDADLAMPFVPAAAVVYLSLFPLIWLAPFVLQTPERLRSFARVLAVLFIVSGVGFVLIPSEEVRSTPSVDGAVGSIFRFADWINLSYNNLPCLHAGMAVACAWFYSQHKGAAARVLVWLWVLAISASTLLTHQHYLIDVAAGAGLAALILRYSPDLHYR